MLVQTEKKKWQEDEVQDDSTRNVRKTSAKEGNVLYIMYYEIENSKLSVSLTHMSVPGNL